MNVDIGEYIPNPGLEDGSKKAIASLISYEAAYTQLSEEHPGLVELDQEIQTRHKQSQDLEQKTVNELARYNPDVQKLIKDKDRFSYYLTELTKHLQTGEGRTEADIIGDLKQFSQIDDLVTERARGKKGRNVARRTDTLAQWQSDRRPAKNASMAVQLVQATQQDVEDSTLVWNYLQRTGILPIEFVDDMETIKTLVAAQTIVETCNETPLGFTSEQKKTLLAHHLLPLVEKQQLNPVLAEEIMNGTFDMHTDFTESLIVGFLDLREQIQKKDPRHVPLHTKLALTAATSFVLLTATASHPPPLEVTAVVQPSPEKKIPVPERHPPADTETYQKETTIPNGEVSTEQGENNAARSGAGATNEASSATSSAEPGSAGENIQQTPKNDDLSTPEARAEVQKKLWDIHGDSEGLYRNHTANVFDFNFAWSTVRVPVGNNLIPPNATEADVQLETQISFNHTVDIPNRYGMTVNPATTKAYSGDTEVPLSVRAYNDNTFTVEFSTDTSTPPGMLIVGYVNGEAINGPPGFNDTATYIDRTLLPDEVNALLSRLENSNLSKREQAEQVGEFSRNEMTYSLNKTWSDTYRKANNEGEYFQRLFTGKHADCDVANTGVVALLRELGIPSRMAFGFKNDEWALNMGKNELTGLEQHGWAEAYIDGAWIPIDGTPQKMDAYTMKIFAEMGMQGMSLPTSLDQARDGLLATWYSFQHSSVRYADDLGAIAVLLGGAAALYTRKLFRPAQDRLVTTDHRIRNSMHRVKKTAERVFRKNDYLANEIVATYRTLTALNPYLRGTLEDSTIAQIILPFNRSLGQQSELARQADITVRDNSEQAAKATTQADFLSILSGVPKEQTETIIRNDNVRNLQTSVVNNITRDLEIYLHTYRLDLERPYHELKSIAQQAKSSQEFIETFNAAMYRKYRKQEQNPIKKLSRALSKSPPREKFPSSEEKWRKTIESRGLHRPLIIYWATIHGQI